MFVFNLYDTYLISSASTKNVLQPMYPIHTFLANRTPLKTTPLVGHLLGTSPPPIIILGKSSQQKQLLSVISISSSPPKSIKQVNICPAHVVLLTPMAPGVKQMARSPSIIEVTLLPAKLVKMERSPSVALIPPPQFCTPPLKKNKKCSLSTRLSPFLVKKHSSSIVGSSLLIDPKILQWCPKITKQCIKAEKTTR
ncbi:hypothetical protein VKT23_008167 [Stygiomarasmius scandens]|uniref:Uncharacterized protein n=1 Tax=Marasmiellus scandens TaxID=2682957 RepID=A0ABR1JLQ8_9AGAR